MPTCKQKAYAFFIWLLVVTQLYRIGRELYRLFQLLFIYLLVYKIVYDVEVNDISSRHYSVIVNKFYIVTDNHTLPRLTRLLEPDIKKVTFKYNNMKIEIYLKDTSVKIEGMTQDIELNDISLDGILQNHKRGMMEQIINS